MKVPEYILHGDYYLSEEIITNKTWKEACKIKKIVILPNGKKVIARTLSKDELETIPQEERGINGYYYCYWTNTPYDSNCAWYMRSIGDFSCGNINYYGCVRLGFHKNEIKQFLDVE